MLVHGHVRQHPQNERVFSSLHGLEKACRGAGAPLEVAPSRIVLYGAGYDRGSVRGGKEAARPLGIRRYSPSEGLSGRSHKVTCAGCIASLTTPTRSSLRVPRSVSSRNRALKAVSVFAASYFLL